MSHTDPIRIAIIGAGLGGLALANALGRRPKDAAKGHPGFEVHVYEAKSVFSDRRGHVALFPDARKALEYCVPDEGALMERAGGFSGAGVPILAIGSGKHAGTSVSVFRRRSEPPRLLDGEQAKAEEKKPMVQQVGPLGANVTRTFLLKELYSALQQCETVIMHLGVKLVSISTSPETILTFDDGKLEKFDAVIGADGYRSIVRPYVLGDKAAEEVATRAGFWDCRNQVPREIAERILFKPLQELLYAKHGEDLDPATPDLVERGFWIGDSHAFLYGGSDGGRTIFFILAGAKEWSGEKHKQTYTRDEVEQNMQAWMKEPYLKPLLDTLFYEQKEVWIYRQYHSKKTSTYNNDRICIMGDAAHSSVPFGVAGAWMAFEDAMILSHLLWNSTVSQISAAFATFTEVRKDRCQHVIEASEGRGRLNTGQSLDAGEVNPDTGYYDFDPVKLPAAYGNKDLVISGIDQQDYRQDAKMRFEKKISKAQ
ncbi:hypothetical protein ANO11243_091120 [Dothideomycetidae sp. 11243]|nr:hypothetical protein ANO11243_091120 [fungal sp. No.11243]